ncbi:MAG: flagellar basal body P-ring formation chaperone FlgA [Oceanicaulis sp.]
MIRAAFASLFALAAGGLFAESGAQDSVRVVLKERPVSEDAVVTLSDLFDGVSEAGDAQLARAPEPGAAISLDPDFVRRTAAHAGLDWPNAGGLPRVTVQRAARLIEPAALTALVEEMLFVEHGEAHAVELSGAQRPLAAPLDAAGGPEVLSFDHDPRSGLFRAEIAAWPGGPAQTVGGRAQPVADVPVLARAIERGEVIDAADIDWVRMPANRVRPETVLSAKALIGQSARRSLRADAPVRSLDIEPPVMIARGETVALVYRSGALVLTARARALEDAAAGETARFVNLASNRTVEGVADAPGRARVHGPAYTH